MAERAFMESATAFITAAKVDRSFLEQAAAMNALILRDKDCRAEYDALLDFADAARDVKSLAGKEESSLQVLVSGALRELRKLANIPKDVISRFSERTDAITSYLDIKVHDFCEIAVASHGYLADFSYPTFSTVPKSSSEDPDVPVQTGVVKSSMVDKNANTVSIGLDGVLSLYFNREKCKDGTWVILIPTVQGQIPRMKMVEPYDSSSLYVKFYDIIPGKYIVVLEDLWKAGE